jgi:hypothetical protein
MSGYYKPLPARIQRGQRFGANPNWGPNPPGGHNGDDYLSQVGEPIYAAGDGEVIHAGQFDSTYGDNFGWNLNFGGNMVVLNLDGDTAPYVEYGHMDQVYVSAGQRVRAGQVIGTTGATDGGTKVITGPHLHVGCLPPNFNLNTNTYGRVNPDIYLTDYPDESVTITTQSATITPIQEEYIMASVEDLKNTLLSPEVLEAIGKAVHTRPVPYFDPETGQDTGTGTNLAVLAGASDFQHSATRRVLASAAGAIVDAVKAAQPQDAANVAQAAYDEFMKKLDATTLKVGVK